MSFRFFQIPSRGDVASEEELNKFLRSHRVLNVDRRWVEHGENSYWALCVDYLETPAAQAGANGRSFGGKNKIDYRTVLSPEDFAVFAKLRDVRKEIAQQDAVPVYTVFTNEQLAKMVQTRASTRAALEQITGVGDARLEKYGERMLAILDDSWKSSHEASGPTV